MDFRESIALGVREAFSKFSEQDLKNLILAPYLELQEEYVNSQEELEELHFGAVVEDDAGCLWFKTGDSDYPWKADYGSETESGMLAEDLPMVIRFQP